MERMIDAVGLEIVRNSWTAALTIPTIGPKMQGDSSLGRVVVVTSAIARWVEGPKEEIDGAGQDL